MHRRIYGLSALLVSAALGLTACGSTGDSGGDDPPVAADTTAPSVPQGVTATAQSATQIVLSWQASTDAGSGVAGYRIFRNGGTTVHATVTAPATTFTDTGLTAATQYSYTVRAFDSASPANESANSSVATATTPSAPPVADTTPPSVPQNLTATAASSTQVNLAWQASTDAGTGVAGYRVFRNGGATPIATVTTLSYSDTGLTAATQYTYTVRAFDRATPTANESAASAAATVTTPAATASGLDARPNNTSCVAGDRPTTTTTLGVERVFPNLSFTAPILMAQAPNDSTRWFVVEQAGRVRVFNNQATVASSSVFVDISARVTSGGETGLLGLAFHPNFPANPRVYLSYTTGNLVSRVSEFRTPDNGATLDPNSEIVLFTVTQPASNHNGGYLSFGPDGFLFVGFGDGGSGNDPFGTIGNGQNLLTLLGKVVRIDISGATGSVPYRIPTNNPYAGNALCNAGSGSANCPEIYAYGFRNPWRWSFDTGSNELWLADVGQNEVEEVNRITLGGNYGWRCFEGTRDTGLACGPNESSSLPPIAQYTHANGGNSITGGFVYRGTAIPSLVGRYVFGDFGSGRIWNIARTTSPTLTVGNADSFSSGLQISSFGQDNAGEVYVVNYSGSLHRLRATTQTTGGTIPTLLTASGCVQANGAPAAGLVPYTPNAPFWSDGLTKQRFLALQNGTTMGVGADGDVNFPNGSVLVKSFRLGNQLVETRLFMRHTDGEWAGYTYEWNAQGTEATRVIGGKSVTVGSQTWQFPSEDQCLQCHTAAAGRSLGLELQQLNGAITYPATGRSANQLVTLNTIQMFNPVLSSAQLATPALPDPYGTAGTVSERARAYLHTNCSQCHRPGGPTNSTMDLRYSTPLAATNACNATPTNNLGIANARIVAPGSAASSVLVARANRRDALAMPPISSTVIDTAGVALLTNWVNSLTSCN
jgi:uncharacterized repeat protein (TIGR03806 family)